MASAACLRRLPPLRRNLLAYEFSNMPDGAVFVTVGFLVENYGLLALLACCYYDENSKAWV